MKLWRQWRNDQQLPWEWAWIREIWTVDLKEKKWRSILSHLIVLLARSIWSIYSSVFITSSLLSSLTNTWELSSIRKKTVLEHDDLPSFILSCKNYVFVGGKRSLSYIEWCEKIRFSESQEMSSAWEETISQTFFQHFLFSFFLIFYFLLGMKNKFSNQLK